MLDEIIDRDLVHQVSDVGARLMTALTELQREHPQMGDVRGRGLFIGIDWVIPDTTNPFLLEAVKNSIAGKIFFKSCPGTSISLAL